ncbi:unnamed protein product [Didymodactylos carnosus]|uniref:Uncharacterized protein n=1 Tax=Didymodactylos carnosus TaxID=1234261 RepID=A0A8S2H233_9BILA|nr:unnamed protein product [Didymodactylos carnosus]CAF3592236.1 unnamed protein product [Didymodactylos carnosus]
MKVSDFIWATRYFKDPVFEILDFEVEKPFQLDIGFAEYSRVDVLDWETRDTSHIEFGQNSYLETNSLTDLQDGGKWDLKSNELTYDTSMDLCLAILLITKQGYDQLVRHKWW